MNELDSVPLGLDYWSGTSDIEWRQSYLNYSEHNLIDVSTTIYIWLGNGIDNEYNFNDNDRLIEALTTIPEEMSNTIL